jgi:cysteine-rich repeat protein
MRSSAPWLLVAGPLVLASCADGRTNLPERDTGPRIDAFVAIDAHEPVPDTGTEAMPDAGRDAFVPTEPDAAPACGNGRIEGTEECEGADLGGETCVTQGYLDGTLRCSADCSFDKSGCTDDLCGNGRIDAGEDCDGANVGSASCASRGFVDGELRCTSSCTFDTAGCSNCGNGRADGTEECDGTDFDGASCTSRGFTGGTLRCSRTCDIDDTACFDASCGNGAREPTEDCDGADLGGRTCTTYGFFGGTLSCNAATCTPNLTLCNNCGNGRVDGIEQCDGAELGGASCASRGFTMGTLRCDARCGFDTSGCSTARCGNGMLESGEACDDGNPNNGDGCTGCMIDTGYACTGAPSTCSPRCGDGMIVGAEQCDGSNLAGQTCATRGFPGGGTLGCDATTCRFVTTSCSATTCGNGSIQTGEECDDSNTLANDGCSSSCQIEPGFYLPVRLRNGDGSNHGMLEIFYSGSWRDVCDDTYTAAARQAMANVVCRQLGYTGTGHEWIEAFGGGTDTPAMDDVNCTGTEPNLSQCTFAGWNVENCSASEAVGIRCAPGEGDIRLVAGPSGLEGRLQLYHAGAWGEVCDDVFDASRYGPATACQQLGYGGGVFVGSYDAPSSTFLVDDVSCNGTERRIESCSHLPYGMENCFPTEGAGLRCSLYTEGATRLVDGAARNSGRVEVLHNNVWGTVCDDFLTATGTRQTNFLGVVCGQLGYVGLDGRRAPGSALLFDAVPDGTDPIWLDDLSCGGAEANLGLCTNPGWNVHNCSHAEDIGATCTP